MARAVAALMAFALAGNACASDAPAKAAAPKATGDLKAAPPASKDAGHGSHGDTVWGQPQPKNPLTIDGKLFVLTLCLFLGLLYVMTNEVWKPLLKSLDDREKRMADALRGAEIARAEALALAEKQERELAAAHAEVRKLIDQARGEAERESDQLLAAAKLKAAEDRAKAMADIDAAKRAALAEVEASSADLAGRVASRVLNRQVEANR